MGPEQAKEYGLIDEVLTTLKSVEHVPEEDDKTSE